MKKTWTVKQDGETYTVSANYTWYSGKLTVTVNDDEYKLEPKFLAGVFGRKENLMLGDRLAIFYQKPFGGAELITSGENAESDA